MMRLTDKARKAFAVGFVAGIGTIGIQDVDADGSTDLRTVIDINLPTSSG